MHTQMEFDNGVGDDACTHAVWCYSASEAISSINLIHSIYAAVH